MRLIQMIFGFRPHNDCARLAPAGPGRGEQRRARGAARQVAREV